MPENTTRLIVAMGEDEFMRALSDLSDEQIGRTPIGELERHAVAKWTQQMAVSP